MFPPCVSDFRSSTGPRQQRGRLIAGSTKVKGLLRQSNSFCGIFVPKTPCSSASTHGLEGLSVGVSNPSKFCWYSAATMHPGLDTRLAPRPAALTHASCDLAQLRLSLLRPPLHPPVSRFGYYCILTLYFVAVSLRGFRKFIRLSVRI